MALLLACQDPRTMCADHTTVVSCMLGTGPVASYTGSAGYGYHRRWKSGRHCHVRETSRALHFDE